tara:strand:+ start:365 stop:1102 length:738 start_codon:yes stop_codon:yes gene_type:complete
MTNVANNTPAKNTAAKARLAAQAERDVAKRAAGKTAEAVSHTATMLAQDYEARKVELAQTAAPTPESITSAIGAAMDQLASAFTELELKVRGDNGSLYPIAADDGRPMLPEGTEGMAIESVNTLAFVQDNLLSTVCWKLEMMLEANAKKSGDQERSVAWARGQVDKGRAESWLVDSKQGFLDQLYYQAALMQTAFDEACRSYEATVGKPYLTRVEREAAAIAKRRELRQPKAAPVSDKLARFTAS